MFNPQAARPLGEISALMVGALAGPWLGWIRAERRPTSIANFVSRPPRTRSKDPYWIFAAVACTCRCDTLGRCRVDHLSAATLRGHKSLDASSALCSFTGERAQTPRVSASSPEAQHPCANTSADCAKPERVAPEGCDERVMIACFMGR